MLRVPCGELKYRCRQDSLACRRRSPPWTGRPLGPPIPPPKWLSTTSNSYVGIVTIARNGPFMTGQAAYSWVWYSRGDGRVPPSPRATAARPGGGDDAGDEPADRPAGHGAGLCPARPPPAPHGRPSPPPAA